jgi:hypothetical protein
LQAKLIKPSFPSPNGSGRPFTAVLQGLMTAANIKRLADIIQCFYCVRYGTTTRSLSRYSLRSFFRFLKVDHPWIAIRLSLLKAFVFREGLHFIAAADEVVEGKSGKLSHIKPFL